MAFAALDLEELKIMRFYWSGKKCVIYLDVVVSVETEALKIFNPINIIKK